MAYRLPELAIASMSYWLKTDAGTQSTTQFPLPAGGGIINPTNLYMHPRRQKFSLKWAAHAFLVMASPRSNLLPLALSFTESSCLSNEPKIAMQSCGNFHIRHQKLFLI
jgi:hypothetical protein